MGMVSCPITKMQSSEGDHLLPGHLNGRQPYMSTTHLVLHAMLVLLHTALPFR